MGRSNERTVRARSERARGARTLLIAATLAVGPALLGWTPGDGPAIAQGDCCGTFSPIGSLMALGDTLAFTAYDARHGWELWGSDGTAEGTRLVKDIRPGKRGSGPENADCEGCSNAEESQPIFAGVAGGNLILWADDGRHGLEPWRSDGTAKGTRLLKDIRPGGKGSRTAGGAEPGAAVGGLLYFGTYDGTHPPALWRTDGTAAGTSLVTDFAGLSDLPVGASQLTPADDGIIFFVSATRDGPGPELWRSDGTPEGTLLVTTSDNGSGLQDLVWVGGALYFADEGTDQPDSARLWRSDGTPEGTMPIKTPINVGGGHFVTAAGATVYIGDTVDIQPKDPNAPEKTRLELWRSDGTAEGTTLVNAVESETFPAFAGAAVVGTTLHFVISSDSGEELWRSDGTPEGTTLVKAFDPGPGDSDSRLVVAGDTLYVVNGEELWRSDGTAEGTTLAVDMAPGTDASVIEGPLVVGDELYYTVGRPSRVELWRSDGTPEGTVRLMTARR